MPTSYKTSDLSILSQSVRNVDWIHLPKRQALPPGRRQRPAPHDKILIANISRNLTYGGFDSELRDLACEDGWRIVGRLPNFDFAARRSEMLADIEKLLRFRDNSCPGAGAIISFGELDYPVEITDGTLSEAELRFRQTLQAISTKGNCFLVCGTYHDPRNYFNKALIFSPGCDEPVEHAKLRPAHKIGESVRTPGNNQLRYYQTPLGNIAVLICMDVFDLNIVLTLARTTFLSDEGGAIDYIVVPAYNAGRSLDASKACERLSYFTNSVVVYTNCQRSMPYNGVYVCGQELVAGSESRSDDDFLWVTRKGSADEPIRYTVLDRGFKEERQIVTPKLYSEWAKAVLLGVQNVEI